MAAKPRINDPAPAPTEATRRGPGRPSKATVRRAAIVEAFVEGIRSFGLAGATVDRVAASMGVSRTLIFHYFGDTETLVCAVVEHIIANSIRRLGSVASGRSSAEDEKMLLDFAFAGPHFDELQDVAVMAEVTALAARDPAIAALLAEAWEGWIAAVVAKIADCFPAADATQCESVGYALICIAEQHWALTFVGPGSSRAAAARSAAERLLATLRAPPHEPDAQARGKARTSKRT